MNIAALVSSVLLLFPSSGISAKPLTLGEITPPKTAIVQVARPTPQSLSQKPQPIQTATKEPAPPTIETPSPPVQTEPSYYIEEIPLSKEVQHTIYTICEQRNVDYALVLGMLKTESNFSTTSQSHNTNGTTDRGIAQINTRYTDYYAAMANIPAENFDPYRVNDAVQALCGQISYLKTHYQSRQYDEHKLTQYILNAYNMGVTGFDRYVKRSGVTSRNYDQKILGIRDHYQALLSSL